MSMINIYNSTVQRISRKTFWMFTITFYLFYGFLFFVIKVIADYQSNPDWWAVIQMMRLLFSLLLIPIINKRLHDFNMSGWFGLFALIPICGYFALSLSVTAVTKAPMIGLLLFGFIIGLIPGTAGQNKYGESPS